MIFKTSDLYLAAFLRTMGITLTSTEIESRKVVFLFEDPGENIIKVLKEDYFLDRARVQALGYAQSIKALKALIHQAIYI